MRDFGLPKTDFLFFFFIFFCSKLGCLLWFRKEEISNDLWFSENVFRSWLRTFSFACFFFRFSLYVLTTLFFPLNAPLVLKDISWNSVSLKALIVNYPRVLIFSVTGALKYLDCSVFKNKLSKTNRLRLIFDKVLFSIVSSKTFI